MIGRILIVEDEPVLRKHLARLFAREGYEVSTAGSRAEALDRLDRAPIDVLLLDIMLPDGDGLDLLAELHERQRCWTVVITACTTPDNERHASLLNVSLVLHKPLDLRELIGAVRHAPTDQRLSRS